MPRQSVTNFTFELGSFTFSAQVLGADPKVDFFKTGTYIGTSDPIRIREAAGVLNGIADFVEGK